MKSEDQTLQTGRELHFHDSFALFQGVYPALHLQPGDPSQLGVYQFLESLSVLSQLPDGPDPLSSSLLSMNLRKRRLPDAKIFPTGFTIGAGLP